MSWRWIPVVAWRGPGHPSVSRVGALGGALLGIVLLVAGCDSGGSPPSNGDEAPTLEALTIELATPDAPPVGAPVTIEAEVAEDYSDDSQASVDAAALLIGGDTVETASNTTRLAKDTSFASAGEQSVAVRARGESNAGSETMEETEEATVSVGQGQAALDRVTAEASPPDAAPAAEESFTLSGSGEEVNTDGSTAPPDSLLVGLGDTQIRALADTGAAEVDTALATGTYAFQVEVYGEGPQGNTDRTTDSQEFTVTEGRKLVDVTATADAPASVDENTTVTLDASGTEKYSDSPMETGVDTLKQIVDGNVVNVTANTNSASLDTSFTADGSSKDVSYEVTAIGRSNESDTIQTATDSQTITVNNVVKLDNIVHAITNVTPQEPNANNPITVDGETILELSDGTTTSADNLELIVQEDGTNVYTSQFNPTKNWSHTTADLSSGDKKVIAEATGEHNGNQYTRSDTTGIHVNAFPEATIEVEGETKEGEELTFTLTGSDPDGTVVDGELDIEVTTPDPDKSGQPPLEATHAFQEGGQYTIDATVTDDDGATTDVEKTVNIEDLVEVTLKTQRVRNNNFVNGATYTVNGKDTTVTGDKYVVELPTGTHSFKIDHPNFFTAYTSFFNPNTGEHVAKTDSSQSQANINITGNTTYHGRKINKEQFDDMTHPNGDPAAFWQLVEQIDSKTAPPEHQGTVKFQESPIIWFNRDDSNTNGPHEQYIKDWATETGNPSMHYFTKGELQAPSIKDGGSRPEAPHIEILYDTTKADPGNGSLMDGNTFEFSRVFLNPQLNKHDTGVVLEEITEALGIDSNPPEYNNSETVLAKDGVDHPPNTPYTTSGYPQTLGGSIYNNIKGMELRDHN